MIDAHFLKTGVALASAPLLGNCHFANEDERGTTSEETFLTAGPAPFELISGKGMTPAMGFGINGSPNNEMPGIIWAKQGEKLRIRFQNQMADPTTIHWHGIRLPNAMDGVPYLTQDPVEPGTDFIYEFTPPDAGSFWFHPHFDSLNQMARGLSGALIVQEKDDPGFDLDLPLVLKDWVINPENGEFGKITSKKGMSRAGTFGNIRTVNNQLRPRYELPSGGWARLRLINVDLTRVYKIILESDHEIEATIIAIDGNPIENPRPFGREHIGPGMRMDLAVRVPDREGLDFRFKNTSSSKPWVMADFVSGKQTDIETGRPLPILKLNPIPVPQLKGAQKIKYRFDSGVGEGFAICGGVHEKLPTFWTINNIPWPEYAVVPPPLDILEMGTSYIFELSNHTPHSHPIHIHGMTFYVLKSNRREIDPFHTDTVLLRPDERVQAAFVADNPGNWMFHCHIIEHQVAGMMGHIQVV